MSVTHHAVRWMRPLSRKGYIIDSLIAETFYFWAFDPVPFFPKFTSLLYINHETLRPVWTSIIHQSPRWFLNIVITFKQVFNSRHSPVLCCWEMLLFNFLFSTDGSVFLNRWLWLIPKNSSFFQYLRRVRGLSLLFLTVVKRFWCNVSWINIYFPKEKKSIKIFYIWLRWYPGCGWRNLREMSMLLIKTNRNPY